MSLNSVQLPRRHWLTPFLSFFIALTFLFLATAEPAFAQKKKKSEVAMMKKSFEEPFVPPIYVKITQTLFIGLYLWLFYSRIRKNLRKNRSKIKRVDQRSIFTYVMLGLLILIIGIYLLLIDPSQNEISVVLKMGALLGGIVLTILSLENRKKNMAFYGAIPFIVYLGLIIFM